MKIQAICNTCRHQHPIDFDPLIGPGAAFSDWLAKHPEHDIDFIYPRRSRKDHDVPHPWMGYIHNADVRPAYAATADFTITLASLATSSSLLVGRQSTAVDNGADKYLDFLISGTITVGTTPTVATIIQTAIIGNLKDTPTWPIAFGATDAAGTVTVQEMHDQICKIVSSIAITTNTSDRPYPFGPMAMGGLFGGWIPDQFVSFVSHSTAVNLNSTGGNHFISRIPVYLTIA